jgi:hypothetical protein
MRKTGLISLLAVAFVFLVWPAGVAQSQFQPPVVKGKNVFNTCTRKQLVDIHRQYYDEESRILISWIDVYWKDPIACTEGKSRITRAISFTFFEHMTPERWGRRDVYPIHRWMSFPTIIDDSDNERLQPIYMELIQRRLNRGEFHVTIDDYCRLMNNINPSYEPERGFADHYLRRALAGCIVIQIRENQPQWY